jgi:nitroimidazol reductase NimA-like FMN-containing flavoprotein (pyridoxamine 5'-phosphate oxidase superfamily)
MDRALGADIVLIKPGRSALILECKYSNRFETVARDGYYQAMTYATETRSRLCEKVVSVVIGPEDVVERPSFTEVVAGTVGTSPPSGIASLLRAMVEK